MRIGITIRTFDPQSGGLQVHAARLASELQARGHQVTVVTRAVSRTPSYQDYFFFSESVSSAQVNGLKVYVLRHSPLWNWLMWIISKCVGHPRFFHIGIKLFQSLFISQILAIMRGVDIIHHIGQAHELIGFVAADAAQKLNVPFLVQPTLHPGQWGDSQFDFYLYRLAQHLLAYTEFEANFFRKCGLDQPCDVVGSGIDDRRDGNGEQWRKLYNIKSPIILFLGRKASDKGYQLLKQAFRLLRVQKPDVTLVCMGPSSIDSMCEENILDLDFGTEQDKHDALSACTMLCVPSEGESFGLVYMEAGRYGKPAIAKKLPVLEELFGQHNAALLVGTPYEKGNQVKLEPEELKDLLLVLLNNPEIVQNIGEKAYLISEQFLWTKVVLRFETAYHCAVTNYTQKTQF